MNTLNIEFEDVKGIIRHYLDEIESVFRMMNCTTEKQAYEEFKKKVEEWKKDFSDLEEKWSSNK